MSGKPSPSRLAAQYQTYPTASAAAVAALRGITNQKTETGGGILYNPEQKVYAATAPVGQNDGAHFEAAVGVPKGWQLHSTYHTHPAGEDRSTQFSDNDISTAQQLKAPSYVLALADNKVRMFDPASSPVSKDSAGSLVGSTRYALGSVVNETPPTPPPPPETPAPALADNATPAATPAPAPAPAASVPVTGSRVTMKDFASRHRAQTTKYRHKIVHVKIKRGAP
jgi:proteasome lid subunit RPN8/RPN11